MLNKDEWKDVSNILPKVFELCLVKTKHGILSAWYTGCSWDGLRLENEPVIYWKYKKLDRYVS